MTKHCTLNRHMGKWKIQMQTVIFRGRANNSLISAVVQQGTSCGLRISSFLGLQYMLP